MVPPNLREIPIPTHLPKFSKSPHKDSTAHVERFKELVVSSLVTNPGHYLIWFPNTSVDSAYSWYQSHAPRTFTTWDQLQIAFLRQFRPETGQQQALAALTNTCQGPTEDTLLVASLLLTEYPLRPSNGAEMYLERYRLNFSTNDGVREKALTCRYASSSPHINSHAGRSVSMGFPCLDINFMKFSKYGFSIEGVDLLYTPKLQGKTITPSLLSCPMVLHKSKTNDPNDPNINEFDLHALK